MLDRFDEKARRAVALAQEEAAALGADYVGTEHLLLGLLREPESVAGRALAVLEVTLADVRERAAAVRPPEEPMTGRIPLAARSTRVLELAGEVAEERGSADVATQDILAALVRGDGGPGARILRDLGVGADRVEETLDDLTM